MVKAAAVRLGVDCVFPETPYAKEEVSAEFSTAFDIIRMDTAHLPNPNICCSVMYLYFMLEMFLYWVLGLGLFALNYYYRYVLCYIIFNIHR